MTKPSRPVPENGGSDVRRLQRLVVTLARLVAVLVLLVALVVVRRPEVIMAVIQLLAALGSVHPVVGGGR